MGVCKNKKYCMLWGYEQNGFPMEKGRGILLCRIITIKAGNGINHWNHYRMLEVNNYDL